MKTALNGFPPSAEQQVLDWFRASHKPVEPPLFNSLRAALKAGTHLAFPVAK